MPSFFDALAGAGQAAMGGQAYRKGKADIAAQEARTQALENADRREAEERKRDEEARNAYATAVGEIEDIKSRLRPDNDEEAIKRWYRGEDDETVADRNAFSKAFKIAARKDPRLAQALMEQYGPALAERSKRKQYDAVVKSGSSAITALNEMVETGQLGEAAAQQMSERVQQALEMLDEDPDSVERVAGVIGQIRSAADEAAMTAANKKAAMTQIQELASQLPQNMAGYGAQAMLALSWGADPRKVVSDLAAKVYGDPTPDPQKEMEAPGQWSKAPEWRKSRIISDAREKARRYLATEATTVEDGVERKLTVDEVEERIDSLLPTFVREEAGRRNLVWDGVEDSQIPDPGGLNEIIFGEWGGGGERKGADLAEPMPARPVDARGMDLAKPMPASGADAGGANLATPMGRAERAPKGEMHIRKRGPKVSAGEYIDYVRKAVGARGGTDEDVWKALRENGITEKDIEAYEAALKRKALPSGPRN